MKLMSSDRVQIRIRSELLKSSWNRIGFGFGSDSRTQPRTQGTLKTKVRWVRGSQLCDLMMIYPFSFGL